LALAVVRDLRERRVPAGPEVEIHALTGRVVECPIDEMNKPRGRKQAALRIPPTDAEVAALFAGWREELLTCRKFAPTARNFVAAKLMSEVGLRVNEVRCLDLADVKWELGRFGKLHVRVGKGARGSGPRERMVPLINGADRTLRWFIEDVWAHFDDNHTRPGAPLFPSERKNADGTCKRIGDDALRTGLAEAAAVHLPTWADRLTPHVMRHFCASQLYLSGLDLISIQELLGGWGPSRGKVALRIGLMATCLGLSQTNVCDRPTSPSRTRRHVVGRGREQLGQGRDS